MKKKKKGIAKDKECIIRNTETKPHFSMSKIILKDFPVAQMLKNLPAMQKAQVWLLKKRKATHSSILAWKIPWTEEPGGL